MQWHPFLFYGFLRRNGIIFRTCVTNSFLRQTIIFRTVKGNENRTFTIQMVILLLFSTIRQSHEPKTNERKSKENPRR